MLFTTRDENGELSVGPSLNNKLAETVSSSTSSQLMNNIYTLGGMESDKDSGVAIELNSLADTMGKRKILTF